MVVTWVIKTFFVQFCVFLPPLLNLFCLLGPCSFCLYCAYFLMKSSLGISNFLEEISNLSHRFFSSIFLYCSLKKSFLSFLAILWTLHSVVYIFPSLLLLFSQLFVSPLQKTILSSCISFPLRGFWPSLLYNVTNSSSAILLQAFCLSDLISWISLSLVLYSHKGFHQGHTWVVWCFSLFLQFKSEFGNKEFII